MHVLWWKMIVLQKGEEEEEEEDAIFSLDCLCINVKHVAEERAAKQKVLAV